MGYESRFYIVKPCRYLSLMENGKYFATILAMFNMGKMGFEPIMNEKKTASVYFFDPSDGDKIVEEDNYGDTLKELTVDEAIDLMKYYDAEDEDRAFLCALRSIKKPDDYLVLHYGY